MNKCVNFALAKFKTKIKCDKVSCDGYEVENLIASQPAQSVPTLTPKNIGFIAEGFTRPPCNITLLFLCNIHIEKILINSKIGGVGCTGFELYTSSFKRDFSSDSNQSSFDLTDEQFLPVGRANNTNKTEFCFYNVNTQKAVPNDCYLMRHHLYKHLNAVSALTVRVTSTLNSSTIAIKSIEVWGRPAIGTDINIVKLLEKTDVNHESNPPPNQCSDSTSLVGNLESENAKIIEMSSVPVPEDFLDSITQEVMSYPILLPCGQLVDQTTLDRHNQEEAKWGRPPNDPFTGKQFSQLSRPMPNIPLKTRIDQFVLKHGQQILSKLNLPGGKTVGVSLFGANKMALSGASHSLGIFSNQSPTFAAGLNSKRLVLKRSSEGSLNEKHSLQSKRSKLTPDPLVQTEVQTEVQTSQMAPSRDDNNMRFNSLYSERERMLKSSLEEAVETTLSHLPSYTKSKAVDERTNSNAHRNESNCTVCELASADKNGDQAQMYRLECSHSICRKCLLIAKQVEHECSWCGCKVNCNNAVRNHRFTSVYDH